MQELSMQETEAVSGGDYSFSDYLGVSTAAGSAAGAAVEIGAGGAIAAIADAAAVGGVYGAAVALSFGAGWAIGSAAYNRFVTYYYD